MPGQRLWCCVFAIVGAVGCNSSPRGVTSLQPAIEIHFATDDESREVAARLGVALDRKLRAGHATEEVILGQPLSVDRLANQLKPIRSRVVIIVGLAPDFRGEVSNAIDIAVRHLDESGTKVFTVIDDLPNTRRRSFFGFAPGDRQRDRVRLAELAADQIFASHVLKRQIPTFQHLPASSYQAAKP